ncbi:MAG: nucleoside transporter, partial [Glaciecola sp.]
ASAMGAKETYPQAADEIKSENERKAAEKVYLSENAIVEAKQVSNTPVQVVISKYLSWLSLLACVVLGLMSYVNQDIAVVTTWLLVPTLVYFVTATYAYLGKNNA